MAGENEEIAAAEDDGDEEEEEEVGDTVAAVAIKQSTDSDNDEQVRKIGCQKRSSYSQSKKQGKKVKEHWKGKKLFLLSKQQCISKIYCH